MTTKIRTLWPKLWLLGVIGLVAPAAGCIESHHGTPSTGGSKACLDTQYFEVQWGIDHGEGTLPLACADVRTMGSSVVLLTNAAPPYDRLPVSYYLTCDDRATCTGSGGLPCNLDGVTSSGVPVGTSIVEADLVSPSGAVLSSAGIDPASASLFAIYSCDYTIAPFVFTLAP